MFPSFEIFGRTIGMYGITTVIGAAICVIVGLKLIKKFKIMWEDFALVMIALAVSLFIFAHIVYGITNLDKLAIIFTNLDKLSFEQLIALLAECFGGAPILGMEGETPETGGTEGDTLNAGQFQDLWTTSGGQEALRFTNELLRKGLLDASSLTYSSRQIRNCLDQGDVLCYIGSVTDFYLDQEQWVTGGLIGVEEDATRYMEVQSIGGYKWTNIFVSKSCTDLAGTAEFLDYMISGDVFSDYDAEEIQKDWWIFKNPMWESRLQIQNNRDKEDNTELQQTLDALQDNASNVKRIDGALLEIPRNHFQMDDFETLYNNIQNYERAKISYLVAADSEESFASRYREFCEGLESLGLQDYEQQMSEVVRENAENMQLINET